MIFTSWTDLKKTWIALPTPGRIPFYSWITVNRGSDTDRFTISKTSAKKLRRKGDARVMKKIGFIGLGKLGLPSAELFSDYYDVSGFDIVPRRSTRIKCAESLDQVVVDKDIVFVAVPTPHERNYGGELPTANLEPRDFDYSAVIEVLRCVKRVARQGQAVVLISTVLPGTCRSLLVHEVPRLRFIYHPFLISMGAVEWDIQNPDLIIVGAENGEDAGVIQRFYEPIVKSPRYAIGTWDEAESIKVFYNTFISAKIALVNMIMDVAERNGNINVDVVTSALKAADKRITGIAYMTAGMGDGGPCHPRDNTALRSLAKRLNLGYDLFQTIMESREKQAENLADTVVRTAEEWQLPIVIHGKSYKPGVPLTDGSYALLVAHYIAERGYKVNWIDPCLDAQRDINSPSVVLLAHGIKPHVTNSSSGGLYCSIPRGSVVVDPWRTYNPSPGVEVVRYGWPHFNGARYTGGVLQQ
jgi:UDPglucose 6-dehydrogenase